MFNSIRKRVGIRLGRIKVGDVVQSALASVGVTEERVQKFLGKPCGCKERKEKWNQLGLWAQRVIAGDLTEEKIAEHKSHLEKLTEIPPEDETKT